MKGPIEAFADCALSYCRLLDSVDEIDRGELVWEAAARLARLYAAGHYLPDESPAGELLDSEATEAEQERRDELQRRLGVKLEGVDTYWLVHDPYDVEGLDLEDIAEYVPAEILEQHRGVFERGRITPDGIPEPVCSILSDDLMDAYSGVKDGLSLYDSGERESAMWEWRFGLPAGLGHRGRQGARRAPLAHARVGRALCRA